MRYGYSFSVQKSLDMVGGDVPKGYMTIEQGGIGDGRRVVDDRGWCEIVHEELRVWNGFNE